MKITKKIIFFLSSFITLFLLIMFSLGFADQCHRENSLCFLLVDILDLIFPVLLVIVLMLPFSLITFWMKEEIFKKWFRFAVWYIPMLIIICLVFSSGGGGGFGAGGAISSSFYWLFIGFFYVIFVITSAIKIAGACDESKKQ